MNLPETMLPELLGLGLVLVFLGLMLVYAAARRKGPGPSLRAIAAFDRLGRAVGLAVEAGQRLHISLGRGNLNGLQGGSALVGLAALQRIARTASVSDRPTVASSGDGSLLVLSQDVLRNAYAAMGVGAQYDPLAAQATGLTPFSYAAGTIPLIYDQQVSANFLAGHFGPEVALITEAAERNESLVLAGSDSLPAQAVLYASAHEPLIGEELYAAGAYIQGRPLQVASLQAQDVARWVLAGVILVGAALKLIGVV